MNNNEDSYGGGGGGGGFYVECQLIGSQKWQEVILLESCH
jgi:hypothetical protein